MNESEITGNAAVDELFRTLWRCPALTEWLKQLKEKQEEAAKHTEKK